MILFIVILAAALICLVISIVKTNRLLKSEPLFWVSLFALAVWLIVLIVYEVVSQKLRMYNERHERDNEIIKSHTVRGGEILSSFKSLEDADEGALYHHERYDGSGYPEKKAGEEIPLIARMICVADSFDAMNTNRVYRNHLTMDHILNEIEANKGRQFDPAIADIMLDLIRSGRIADEEA